MFQFLVSRGLLQIFKKQYIHFCGLKLQMVGPKFKLKQGAVLNLFCFTNPEKKHHSLEIQPKEQVNSDDKTRCVYFPKRNRNNHDGCFE